MYLYMYVYYIIQYILQYTECRLHCTLHKTIYTSCGIKTNYPTMRMENLKLHIGIWIQLRDTMLG